MKRVFVSDCEGPISKNDNAFELSEHFLPNGDKLFSLVSKYDDILADIANKPGYNAGDTLKLIVPFLKAYGVTDRQVGEFSAEKLVLISGSKEALHYIRQTGDAYIVSTSYEHYIRALCRALEFPFENTYCTRISMDKYVISEQEKTKLRVVAQEIASMPMMTIPPNATSVQDLSSEDQETILRLDEIFWKEIAGMRCGMILSEVRTIGGREKAEAIKDIAEKHHLALSGVMYVGDSITDVHAFQLVKKSGGLAISFNGNSYAVKNADISVISEDNLVTAVLANIFLKCGKEEAIKLAQNWSPELLLSADVDKRLIDQFLCLHPKALPKVQIVTTANKESLSTESSEFRKKVRGEAVGKLG